ncbi:MAG: hypothetical protein HY717_04850 [Planctomycetes bacterium]|nr:hypothetical protein [Planctomycetota bacterium]
MDINDDGRIDTSDTAYLLGWLFIGDVGPPPAPSSASGPDPTSDGIACFDYQPSQAPVLDLFALGLEGHPVSISGAPGEKKSFEVFITLTTSNNQGAKGAAGWSLSIGVENLKVLDFSFAGTPYENKAGLFEGEIGVVDPDFDTGSGPHGEGAVAAALLDRGKTLPPNGVEKLAKLILEAEIPAAGDGLARIFLSDGKRGRGQSVDNNITFNYSSSAPVLGSVSIPLSAGGRQVPGDCNQDGGLDIADAICLLGNLFLGNPPALPCGAGRPTDPGNLRLLDWQPDGKVDLSDAVSALIFLFLGGPHHRLAIPVNEDSGCVSMEGCSSNGKCP